MLANAAGPVFAVYCLAVSLPKMEFVGTSAWFFLIVNSFKIPFSLALGLIHGGTLLLNLLLSPVIVAGLLAGRWLTARIPQRDVRPAAARVRRDRGVATGRACSERGCRAAAVS